jgi:hypothetical protein
VPFIENLKSYVLFLNNYGAMLLQYSYEDSTLITLHLTRQLVQPAGMEKTQRDSCSERLGLYSVFKHTVNEVPREKGMYCALCKIVRVERFHRCEECDKTWCEECWVKVRLQWCLNHIEVNTFARKLTLLLL